MVFLPILQHMTQLLALTVAYQYIRAMARSRFFQSDLFPALYFAFITLLEMSTPVHLTTGLFYDGRSIVLLVAAVFLGPTTALTSGAASMLYRIVIGGQGMYIGIFVIAESLAAGLLFRKLIASGKTKLSTGPLIMLAVIVHLFMLAAHMSLSGEIRWAYIRELAPTLLIVYPAVFRLESWIFMNAASMAREHDALVESESRYRNMFESNGAAMLIIDPSDGRITDANAAALRFYGWNRGELLVKRISDINELGEKNPRVLMDYVPETGYRLFLVRHRLASGEVRDVEVLAGILRFNGRPFIHSIIHDVTEREEAFRERRLLYETIDASVSEVFIFSTQDHRFIYASRGARENLGFTMDELRNMTPLDLKKDMKPYPFAQILDELSSGRKNLVVFRTAHYRKNGSSYPVEVKIQLQESGKEKVFLALVSDMTDYQKALDEIKSQLRELERWRDLTLDREERIIALKREVNGVLEASGAPPRYSGEHLGGRET
jgi:PAS domain S-box-containing protein